MTAAERPLLESARLVLDGFREEDLATMTAMYADPEVMRYIGGGVRTPELARAEAEALLATPHPPPLGRWAIRERGRNELLGWAGLMPLGDDGDIELAYRLTPATWGRGIASEAARRLVDHAFDGIGLERLVAITSHDNTASQRVLTKLGFTFRTRVTVMGIEGVWYYDLLARHWPRLNAWRAARAVG